VIRVKVSARGGEPASNLSQFVGNAQNRWGHCEIFLNRPISQADVWVVSEDVADDDLVCQVPAERVVFVSAETSWEPDFYAPGTSRAVFLEQFVKIYTCHDIYLPQVVNAPPFLPWMINANHSSVFDAHERDLKFFEALVHLPKDRRISVFCSAQSLTANHRMRLRFVEKLKEHFGERLDWFGNGINPLPEKWTGLAPYRYTIVLENQSTQNIFTEKIYDAYLGLAFPIYWGAPNLGDFFPRDSFAPINIRDLKGSIGIVEDLLASDTAEVRRESLLEAKRRVLRDWNVFGRLATIAEEVVRATPDAKARRVELTSWTAADLAALPTGAMVRMGRKIMGVGRRLAEPR
jgi:hypothetical protein